MKTQQITLPADVYDTLELSAYAFGGIGADDYGTDTTQPSLTTPDADFFITYSGFVNELANAAPVCAVGHAAFTALPGNWWQLLPGGTITRNDEAVEAINARKGKTGGGLFDRVSFEEWVKELDIVRGDQ